VSVDISLTRITVRDITEAYTGQLRAFSEANFVQRWNGVGSWNIKCPATALGAELFKPGCSISVVLPDGQTFSGQMTSFVKTKDPDNRGGTIEVSGVSDTAILGFRVVYPVPSQPVTLQTASATWNASGPAETVARNLVVQNIGPSAPLTFRRITNLAIDPDQGRGSNVSISARYDNLLDQIQRILSPVGLGFSVKAEFGGYRFSVVAARDLSLDFKFSEQIGNLDGWEYSLNAPQISYGIVAGSGEGTARNVIIEHDPRLVENTWGWVIEQFIDRRDTNVLAELQQAAAEAFAELGPLYSLTINPIDTDSVQFGRDYTLGDKVTVQIDGTNYVDTITQVRYEIKPGSLRIRPTIGNAESVYGRALDIYRVVRLIASRVGLLEKRF